MASVTIKQNNGSDGAALSLSDEVFGVEPNLQCVRAVLNQYLGNQRSGTHSTKTRGMVRGGGRKPFRQKGTGRARQGSIRAVQWRGGAIAFGPSPRDYTSKVNRKVRRTAFKSIFSELVRDEKLIVIEDFALDAIKTKALVEMIAGLGVDGTALLVSAATDEKMALSARNVPGFTPSNVDNLNIYDLLTHDYVVITQSAVKKIEEVYA